MTKKYKGVLLIIIILGLLNSVSSQDFKIIAHKDIGFDSLTAKDIKYIFLGKLNKLKKVKIIPTTLKSGNVHKDFLEKYIRKTSSQFSKFWKKILFTGKGKPPKSFKTEMELVKYVASTPGAIGYVGKDVKLDGLVLIKIIE